MRTERKHVHLRTGDQEALKRIHPEIPLSEVVRLLVANYVDSRSDKIVKAPDVKVKL